MRFQNSFILASLLTGLTACALPQNENGGSDAPASSAVASGDDNAVSADTAISTNAAGSVANDESTDTAGANFTASEILLAVATASSSVTASSSSSEKVESAAASAVESTSSSEGNGIASGANSTASAASNYSFNSTDSSGALQVAGLPAGFEWVIGGGAMVVGALGVSVAAVF
ncbi:hypothetical protein I308_101379 [Cryptococcus tetragattii IND107]|uniref:Secreted protein n=1 Tax=Cryptococcus tetragattii IND107 TaxID=1296105 RepID=A0ABR3C051_9TREE|nr:hypothetical protein I308_04300 [Cryptococcus tetragattii IND107]